ncbi:AI-2E family transporter [Actinocatenispora rupis]|uniref:AI-2E family transporter n=1 Tax=Actinocatenispora rupis TaxID=519421 RepID=A0A8J3J5I5_9ACTN|nr:AI-2E family transporter [Actinocatenispora rupis]GID16271.1 AI-2E family transporter [Actinocatenispora rupis]
MTPPPPEPHRGLRGWPWRYATITAVVLLTIGVAALVVQARAVLVLIFLSFLLAAGLDPLVRWVQRLVRRRGFAVLVVCVGLTAAVVGMAVVALIPAVRQFGQFVDSLPAIVERFAHDVGDRSTALGRYLSDPRIQSAVQNGLGKLPELLTSGVGALFGLLSKLFGLVFSVLTIAALTVYFMLALPRIVANIGTLLGSAEKAAVLDEALGKVGGYITGQLVICLAAGGSAYVFFLIVGVPYPALIALGVAVLDLVPQVGATLGAILGALMALSVSLGVALGTVAFFVAYQQVENYLLAPRILAQATALSPLSAFIAALIGGAAGGLVGAVAALPVAAALQVVIRYAFRDRFARAGPAPDSPPDRNSARGNDSGSVPGDDSDRNSARGNNSGSVPGDDSGPGSGSGGDDGDGAADR